MVQTRCRTKDTYRQMVGDSCGLYMNKVDDCKTEMLIVWLRLETCTWTSLITAVVNIGRRDIAETLGKKYGEGCFSSICTFLYTCTYLSITLHIQASQYR